MRDLTGQRFGRLVARTETEERTVNGCVKWLCRCDCGTYRKVSSQHLVSGGVRSCGCLVREAWARGPTVEGLVGMALRHLDRAQKIAASAVRDGALSELARKAGR